MQWLWSETCNSPGNKEKEKKQKNSQAVIVGDFGHKKMIVILQGQTRQTKINEILETCFSASTESFWTTIEDFYESLHVLVMDATSKGTQHWFNVSKQQQKLLLLKRKKCKYLSAADRKY